MTEADKSSAKISEEEIARRSRLSPAARRALQEADERHAAQLAASPLPAGEKGGPTRIEPTRYGDWERKGIAYDF